MTKPSPPPLTGAPDRPGAVVAGPGAGATQALDVMLGHHARLLRLCDALESIADSLPERVDVRQCLQTARSLGPAVRDAHRFEEEVFYPLARAVIGPRPRFEDNLTRLQDEHREDESFADEAAEALMDWGLCGGPRGSDMTGYMLRGLFETLRRHIAFEREYLVAPVEEHLAR